MRHIYQSQQWLPFPVEYVFAFFANPENLPRLMPPWQKTRMEEATFIAPPPAPIIPGSPLRAKSIAAGTGTRLTISFRPFPFSPIRVPWESEITEFIWNDHFCDLQLRGPFAYWRHCHTLKPEEQQDPTGKFTSGTLLLDKVEYEMPLGKSGELAHNLIIKRQLAKTFEFRHKRTLELLAVMQAAYISGSIRIPK